jgi:glutathione peroxidase
MRPFQFLFTITSFLQIFGCNAKKIISLKKPDYIQETQYSIYDIEVTSIEGKNVKLEKYKGKKLVILNVASKCGYTNQYADWQKYYESKKENVVILGFPCNQFLWQENKSNEDIANFCSIKYNVTFPMHEKINVRGKSAHELYQWLSDPNKNGWNKQAPTWNFCKYVIDETGQLTAFYSSKILPIDMEI